MESVIITLLIGVIIGLIIFRPHEGPYSGRDNTGLIIILFLTLGLIGYRFYLSALEKKDVARTTTDELHKSVVEEDTSLARVEIPQDTMSAKITELDPPVDQPVDPELKEWITKNDFRYTIQVGAFQNKENAQNLLNEIKYKFQIDGAIFEATQNTPTIHKVWVGIFANELEAETFRNRLAEKHYSSLKPHLILVESERFYAALDMEKSSEQLSVFTS